MAGSLNSVVVRRNYIATSNPFGLQEPPKTFLDSLEALDADLVIFPSTHEPLYRIARRCTKTKGIYKVLKNYPDTEVLVAHRLDIWKSVLPTSLDMSWERVLLEIPEFDQWRFKDPTAVADHLEAHEARGQASLDREIADGASQIAGEGYRVLTRQNGSRIHMNEVRGASRPRNGKHQPMKFRGGTGSAVFVGR